MFYILSMRCADVIRGGHKRFAVPNFLCLLVSSVPFSSFCTITVFSNSFQESEGGLYVCMNTFLGFGREHVERHYRKTGQCVYMHLKRHVIEVRFVASVWESLIPHLQVQLK